MVTPFTIVNMIAVHETVLTLTSVTSILQLRVFANYNRWKNENTQCLPKLDLLQVLFSMMFNSYMMTS